MDPITVVGFGVGVTAVITVLALVMIHPHPSPAQFNVFRTVIALGGAGFALSLTGFLTLNLESSEKSYIRSGGTLAVFVLLYLFSPASSLGVKPEQDVSPLSRKRRAASSVNAAAQEEAEDRLRQMKGRFHERNFHREVYGLSRGTGETDQLSTWALARLIRAGWGNDKALECRVHDFDALVLSEVDRKNEQKVALAEQILLRVLKTLGIRERRGKNH